MKFIIIGNQYCGSENIIKYLNDADITKIGKLFTNIEEASYTKSFANYIQYDNEKINEIYLNKSFVFMHEIYTKKCKYYEGITQEEWDNNDIFIINPKQLVSIPLFKEPVLFIWLDNNFQNRFYNFQKCKKTKKDFDFNEEEKIESSVVNEFIEKIYNTPESSLIYFFNEDIVRVSTIIYTLYKYPELIELYSKTFN